MKSFLAVCFSLLCAISIHAATDTEHWRPNFHFTPKKNWINDPNGMVYYDGEYHLFYQHNPFGDKWGHMSWGHAVSRDLLQWEELPVALAEENGVMIFSGSAVVDWKNTSGFGKGGKPPLIAIYTGHYTEKPLQNQQIAYSNDRGRTWTKYAGNPVIDIGEKDFRDPKVFWHEPTQRWVMVVAWPIQHKIRLYGSKDLKQWQHLSDFGPAGASKGIWECPDLFPLPIEGSRNRKWVMIVNTFEAPAGGSGCQYFIGDFDGTTFTMDTNIHKTAPEFIPAGSLLADFEGTNYGEWKSTGTAFGHGPVTGTLPNQQHVGGFRGKGLVNSYFNGDQTTGKLMSPEFKLTQSYINFLIGGGKHPGKACINLLVDGKVVRTETGNDSEGLSWKHWDVREFRGKRAVIEIVDDVTGGWGHINVDHILLANDKVRAATDGALWADHGPDFYAAVSWSDIPRKDGRRLWLGWMSNWHYAGEVPTSPWRNAMSLPRELTLRRTAEGMRLIQQPVRELQTARKRIASMHNKSLSQANSALKPYADLGTSFEINAKLRSIGTNRFGFKLHFGTDAELQVTIDTALETISIDRADSGRIDFNPSFVRPIQAPIKLRDGRTDLRIIVDACSVEVFGQGGEVALTSLIFPPAGKRRLELFSDSANGSFRCGDLKIYALKHER